MSLTFLSPKWRILSPTFRQLNFFVTPAHAKQVKVGFSIHKIMQPGNAQQKTIRISYGDPRAMAPMGYTVIYLSGLQPRSSEGDRADGKSLSGLQPQKSEGDGTHGKSQEKSHHDFAAKICETTYKFNKRVVKLDGMQGLTAIPTQEKKIQQRKGSLCRNNSQETKGAERAADCILPIGMLPPGGLPSSSRKRRFQTIKWKSSD